MNFITRLVMKETFWELLITGVLSAILAIYLVNRLHLDKDQ